MILPNIQDPCIYLIWIYLGICLLCEYLSTDFSKRRWNILTKIISTANSLMCIYLVYNVLLKSHGNLTELFDFNFSGTSYDQNYETETGMLLYFSSYLFIDGIFSVFVDGLKTDRMSLMHHFVGGYGIYTIATLKKGLGLGFYFAFTEISTPFLNISWYFYTNEMKGTIVNLVFLMFYLTFFFSRILTIPLLIGYIVKNYYAVLDLPWLICINFYVDTCLLIFLNVTWYIKITLKLLSLNKNNIEK